MWWHAFDANSEQFIRLRTNRCPGRCELRGRIQSDTYADRNSHAHGDNDSNSGGDTDPAGNNTNTDAGNNLDTNAGYHAYSDSAGHADAFAFRNADATAAPNGDTNANRRARDEPNSQRDRVTDSWDDPGRNSDGYSCQHSNSNTRIRGPQSLDSDARSAR